MTRTLPTVYLMTVRANRPGNPSIASQLEKLRVEYDVPALGVSVGPHFKGAVVGTRKVHTDVNATMHDVYHIGSNTKAMTATVIAVLVEEGILSWQTTLGEVLTDYSMLEVYRNVTIELLTSHRSGITDDSAQDETFFTSLTNVSAPLGRSRMAKQTLSSPSNSTQGIWVYANMNYVLAGLIIDVTTGQTVEDIMYSKLFKPLSMFSAGWGSTPQSSITSIDNPWGHIMTADGPQAVGEGEDNRYRDLPAGLSTAGLLHMTIQDWNKFLTMHLQAAKGRPPKTVKLSVKGFQKLHTSAPGPPPEEFPGFGYTYGGLARGEDASVPGQYMLAHCGSNDRNFACVNIITTNSTIFTSFTNEGGSAANNVTIELLASLRNGTMLF
ncbi:beta-lactamase [Exophiala aquamarina CBS 119918]|uniref:Beta-lactamase n=1 Tax=Exophiala aquamarina CBS 119918 TaxID=1182545 RepID=A0A072PLX1_9EURO|nr:beta-lactamase [Exophiala aquamarina CBS 119918]KEF56540.1 beta-lactamase [Exophiala aquamarina CBS 119918]